MRTKSFNAEFAECRATASIEELSEGLRMSNRVDVSVLRIVSEVLSGDGS